ncbi:MAG TPA: polysaccharide biosynthesis C-terminal domain-containing protein, partial [Ktedonobacteraceae bacterium]|nr:polysaccharide biosynthesis C-terminal domain-containing protein [Ktedonobacteraceae bacterium]
FLYHRTEFEPSVLVLQLLAPGLVLLYANTVFNTVIMSTKQEKKITIVAAIALVFNLALNLILIPRLEQNGAALVTSLTELLLFCLSVAFVSRHLLPFGSLRVALKVTVASLVMAVAIFVLRTFNIFVILAVAMPVYVIGTALLGTIPREDMQALYMAIRRKTQGAVALVVEEQEAELAFEASQEMLEEIPSIADNRIENSPAAEMLDVFDDEQTEKRPRVRLSDMQMKAVSPEATS